MKENPFKTYKDLVATKDRLLPPLFIGRPFLQIGTARLTLRPLQDTDVEALTTLANNRKVAERLTRLPYPYKREDAHKFIAYAQKGIETGEYLHLAIERREDNTLIGMIGWEAELGYWLGEPFWGQGYGKEAATEFVRFLFNTLGKDKIIGSAKETNVASCRIFEGLGFQETGKKDTPSMVTEDLHPSITYALTRQGFMAHYKALNLPIVWAVVAAFINKEKKLLITQRRPEKMLGGVWEVVGGKIETGEMPVDALVREVEEEIGVRVAPDHLQPLGFVTYPYGTFSVVVLVYLCEQWEGTPYGAEGQNLAWVTQSELAARPLVPGAIPFFLQVMDRLK